MRLLWLVPAMWLTTVSRSTPALGVASSTMQALTSSSAAERFILTATTKSSAGERVYYAWTVLTAAMASIVQKVAISAKKLSITIFSNDQEVSDEKYAILPH